MNRSSELFARFFVDQRPSTGTLQSTLDTYARGDDDPALKRAVRDTVRDLRSAGATAEQVVIVMKAILERASVPQSPFDEGTGLHDLAVQWCIQEYYRREERSAVRD